jgi:hypothetical protein
MKKISSRERRAHVPSNREFSRLRYVLPKLTPYQSSSESSALIDTHIPQRSVKQVLNM